MVRIRLTPGTGQGVCLKRKVGRHSLQPLFIRRGDQNIIKKKEGASNLRRRKSGVGPNGYSRLFGVTQAKNARFTRKNCGAIMAVNRPGGNCRRCLSCHIAVNARRSEGVETVLCAGGGDGQTSKPKEGTVKGYLEAYQTWSQAWRLPKSNREWKKNLLEAYYTTWN